MSSQVLHIPIDKAGRVVLPKEIRDRMGLREGTEFEVLEEPDKIILKPVSKKNKMVRKGGVLVVVPDKSNPYVDLGELINKEREKRIREFL